MLVLSSDKFYQEKYFLIEIIKYITEDLDLPEDLCPSFLEDSLVLRYPQYESTIRERIKFWGKMTEMSLEEYFSHLIGLERLLEETVRERRFLS